MSRTSAAAGFLAVGLLVGCGSSKSPSANEEFLRGIEQLRASHGAKRLHPQLVRTIAALRHEPPTPGRRLAIQGFAWTLRGVDAQVDLIETDSGKLEAAVKDAARADRCRARSANLLRKASRALGVSVGELGGY